MTHSDVVNFLMYFLMHNYTLEMIDATFDWSTNTVS